MPRHFADDDDDGPEEGFQFDDDDAATIPCPHCRKAVYEDAEQCPHCRQYLSAEDRPVVPKPWWLVASVVLCLIVAFYWVFGH